MAFNYSLIDNWPEPMLLLDGERFIDANAAAVALLGYADKSALLQRRPACISPDFQPDGEGSVRKAQRLLERALAGETLRFEWVHVNVREQEVYVDVTLSPIMLDGRQVVLCAWHDIGELKRTQKALSESEAWFRSFFEKNSSIMLLIEPESGAIMGANQAAAEFYGYSREQLLTLTISDINALPPEKVKEERQRALREERAYFNFPHRLQNGEIHEVEVHSTPIRNGGRILLFSIIHDVSARKRAEQALKDANRDLLEANSELESFTYAASHDMKAPLGRINSFSTLLVQNYGDHLEGDGLTALDLIQQNAKRLNALVEDLLKHIQLSKQAWTLRPVDLKATVHSVLYERADDISRIGADLRVDVPDGLSLESNPLALSQILRNLVDNALKYSRHAKPPVIEISARIAEGRCHLSVRDNGIGIDPVYHEKIFDIFRRLHSYAEYPGSGMGLALVKKAVERLNGRVWVESEPEKGATFHLEFEAPGG